MTEAHRARRLGTQLEPRALVDCVRLRPECPHTRRLDRLCPDREPSSRRTTCTPCGCLARFRQRPRSRRGAKRPQARQGESEALCSSWPVAPRPSDPVLPQCQRTCGWLRIHRVRPTQQRRLRHPAWRHAASRQSHRADAARSAGREARERSRTYCPDTREHRHRLPRTRAVDSGYGIWRSQCRQRRDRCRERWLKPSALV